MKEPRLQIFAGTATPGLARSVAKRLFVSTAAVDLKRFPDGEISCRVKDDVRGNDVFVIQSTCPPVDQNLMELLVLIDCLRRASAHRITAVIPYFGYARQDRKDEGRVPITAKLVANLITEAGASRVLSIDLHANQIQGFFDIPVDHLYGSPVLAKYFLDLNITKPVMVAPDVGSIKMARAYAKIIGADLAIVDKRRSGPDETEAMHLIGEVADRHVIMVDDMIATGGSILQAARALKEHGANDIYVAATHAVLCGPAHERLAEAPIKQVVLTDTIPLNQKCDKYKILSVASLVAAAVGRIHQSESVSSLFDESTWMDDSGSN